MVLHSMTGFGKSTVKVSSGAYTVDIKTLNSKSADIRIKMPSILYEKEYAIRKILQDKIVRGRIDVVISQEGDNASDFSFNSKLFKLYYQEIERTTKELGIKDPDIFSAVMRIPAVVSSGDTLISEEDWEKFEKGLDDAIAELQQFRINEGKVLANDLRQRVDLIKALIPQIVPFENARVERLKERLRKNMDEYFSSDKIDQNRFEQEILYYLERIDITEEKIRLDQHCDHFIEQMLKDDPQVGKLLSFISQEMGREINTLGSKAQDSDMQQIVVTMKDELEKIKEQLANIL
jgi:uncharacterized protein (TIGR00255 family)